MNFNEYRGVGLECKVHARIHYFFMKFLRNPDNHRLGTISGCRRVADPQQLYGLDFKK